MKEELQSEIDVIERRKKMILEFMEEKAYVPMKAKELASVFQVPKQMRREFTKILDELLEEGRISISSRGKYGLTEAFAISGTLETNKKQGTGWKKSGRKNYTGS